MQTVSRLINTFTPHHYSLSTTINRLERTFSGTVSITGDSADGGLCVHAKGLTIESVTVNGHVATWHPTDNDEVTIVCEQFTGGKAIIVIGYHGTITDAMHGLYPCYYEADGVKKELLATQFESHHAREVFPCVDEPEAKATYDVTLTTETGVQILGNMPVAEQRVENNQLVTTFATTPRMSSYLLAWVVGDLHKQSAVTKRGVEVNVWATPAQSPDSLSFALDIATRTIDFFEEYFGIDYPLPKSDHVALPDFSSGAMENWGLITYREIALLADPKTTSVAGRHYIATVIAHELSHQWFGNLVTMKWWNNLWLNESFATLMEYVAVDALHPEWNVWLDFATQESILALRRDAIDGVQSVQVEVNHPDEISSLFDGAIVYAKGARLMRMCQEYIGHDAFRAGLASYFKEFAYHNTEADDLWRHLTATSGKDIASMMNIWISESGYPVIHVTPEGLRQERFFVGPHQPSTTLWPIPLAADSADIPAMLAEREVLAPIASTDRLNIRGASHFITHYTDEHVARLLEQVSSYDEIGRLQLLHEQTLLARGGVVSSATLVDFLAHYTHENTESVWDILALTIGELKKFVESDQVAETKLRTLAGQLARTQFERLGWEQKSGEPEEDTKLRSTILGLMIYSEDPDILARVDELYASGIDTLAPEIRALVIGSIVKRSTDSTLIESLLERYRTTQSADFREDLCSGLTSVQDPSHTAVVLAQLTDKQTIRPQDIFRWFAYLIRNRYARVATWQWLQDNWQWIIENFEGDKSYDDFPRYAASGLVTRSQFSEYKAFFSPKRDIPALTRTIDLGILEIEGRLELLERDSDAVISRLQ